MNAITTIRPDVETNGVTHISDALLRAVHGLNPQSRIPAYEAQGRRVLRRGPTPCWLSVDEAVQEAFTLTAALTRTADPGHVLPLLTQLAWAIRDAREAGTDPTPPAANAMAVPEQRAA